MSNRRLKLVALSLTLLVAAGCSKAEANVEATSIGPEISVAEVIATPLHDFEEFTGRLEERERVEIRSRVDGYVDSVHFRDGARVKRGQLLFRIDPRPFDAEVNRSSSEVERAKAELTLSLLNHERGKRLLAGAVISESEADKLAADEAGARGALGASAASLQAARLRREFTSVRAPIDGRISRALIRPGNLVSSASLLTTVVSEGPLLAYFDADERSYLRLMEARRASGGRDAPAQVFMALQNEAGYPHAGRLDFLDNRVDPRNGTIALRAWFENADGKLTPGLFARLKLVLPDNREAVLIEERAVGTDLGKKFVLALEKGDTLAYREVLLGREVDGLRQVKQGLRAGDVIVVNGLQRVRPGIKVLPKRVVMNAGGPGLEQLQPVKKATALARTDAR